MSGRLYCFLVLVLGVGTTAVGHAIDADIVMAVGGVLIGHGIVKGAMA